MRILTAREFRAEWTTLDEPVEIAARGRTVGYFYPVTHAPDVATRIGDSFDTIKRVIKEQTPDPALQPTSLARPIPTDRMAREFRPVPKPSKAGKR